jgi:hypothetical protein
MPQGTSYLQPKESYGYDKQLDEALDKGYPYPTA